MQRFGDLLDIIDEADGVSEKDAHGSNHLASHLLSGPCNVRIDEQSMQSTVALQRAFDNLNLEQLLDLNFSVTIADPMQKDCPIVACSTGFITLTGYGMEEIIGRNCRFLLEGVSQDLIDEETRSQCRSFCKSANDGSEYSGRTEVMPSGLSKCWPPLSSGEFICIQTNARKNGELFKNMFCIKQVELDEVPCILGLHAEIPEELWACSGVEKLQKTCHDAWMRLDANMEMIEQVLAERFWYSGSMRR